MSKKDTVSRAPDLKDATVSKAAVRDQGKDSGKESRTDGKSPLGHSERTGLLAKVASFKEYLIASRAELRKVTWPTWKETRATSIVVLGFVAVMTILLGVVDLFLSTVMRWILS